MEENLSIGGKQLDNWEDIEDRNGGGTYVEVLCDGQID